MRAYLNISVITNLWNLASLLGFGMGGQFDYSGLWIGADFSHGHSKAGPLCTTYMSPRLSSQEEFTIDQVEGKY
jgi:TLD